MKKKNAFLKINSNIKTLKKKHIAILVRNKTESKIIKHALNNLNVPNIYLSKKKNIFKSQESREIFWILKAIINFKNINDLKRACFTNIIKKTFNEIFYLEKDYKILSHIITEFQEYYTILNKFGILNLIETISSKYIKNQDNKNNININNVITIGELLQKKFEDYYHYEELIIWFKNKIFQPTLTNKKNQIKIFNHEKYITILSIHQSKGLEFPIVWIPFGINQINHLKNNESILSEEIRLLYVACTRAIIHCSIGITYLKKKNNTNQKKLENIPFKHIIQCKKNINYLEFNKKLKKIHHKNVIEIHSKSDTNSYYEYQHKIPITLKKTDIHIKNKTTKNNLYFGENTSFSKIKQKYIKNQSCNNNLKYYINYQSNHKINYEYNIHNFPKGKKSGIFLHKILKKTKFHKKINISWLSKELEKENISKKWIKILENWYHNIIHAPIQGKTLTLSKIHPNKYIKELKFYIPIQKKIDIKKIYTTPKPDNRKTEINTSINLKKISGMLHGAIDLVFYWKKKYYLIDYKSNWLGKNNNFYTTQNIKNEILKNNYDLQYQIYSLALHRYLDTKIKKYSFKKHFGGIFYIFLRAIEKKSKNFGIFFHLPKESEIQKLDKLFK